MATIKSYTDIEQSKKLAEILPLESADMQWFLEEDYGIVQIKEELQDWGGDCTVPCWSLAALLDVVRKTIGYTIYGIKNVYISCELGDFKRIETDLYDNEVDACVAMIEKLYKLNLL